MTEPLRNQWISDKLSEDDLRKELERKNFLPYGGMSERILRSIDLNSLEMICESVNSFQVPYEFLISQNPIENIAMYYTLINLKKQGKSLPNDISELIFTIREHYFNNLGFSNLLRTLEYQTDPNSDDRKDYPLEILPEGMHQKRIETLPFQIIEEFKQAFDNPLTREILPKTEGVNIQDYLISQIHLRLSQDYHLNFNS